MHLFSFYKMVDFLFSECSDDLREPQKHGEDSVDDEELAPSHYHNYDVTSLLMMTIAAIGWKRCRNK